MPKRKTYFTCKSCKSKHIKPIDEDCPFNINVIENDNISVVDSNVDKIDNLVQDSNQNSVSQDLGSQILSAIHTFDSRLTAMEQKVQNNPMSLTTGQHSGVAGRSPVPVVNHSSQA